MLEILKLESRGCDARARIFYGIGEKMKTIKTEFYRYGNTIVASYRKAGCLGAYSLAPSAQQFEPGLQILAMIDFDRNGLAEKITRQGFIQIARERGIKELPLEIMTPKKAVDTKKRTAKKPSSQAVAAT